MTSEILDLDKELGLDEAEIPTVPFRLFGRDWHLLTSVNFFSLADATKGDAAGVATFLRNAVVPEERDEWSNALAADAKLDGDKIAKLFNRIIEVQADRPTNKPAPNSRPASKRTSSPKSAGRSSSARAARSTA